MSDSQQSNQQTYQSSFSPNYMADMFMNNMIISKLGNIMNNEL